ncbi:pepsin/retropepsin-like aspartic protease family protein [Fundidesulfovibrio putealis]|uniref:hypothetical protein n=1 Tax=Fundidesulfovibrio putealis TaxID=270496 RepID=UPI000425A63E|nr:hypothetical protein [Fundidesulfovibrio putealis]
MPGRTAFSASPDADARLACGSARALAAFLALALLLCGVLSAFPAPALAAEPVAVPLLDRMPDGKRIGYWVPVSFGGKDPVPLLLDTGSKGLMVMASRLGNAPVKRTGRRMTQVFLDGTTFQGEIVRTKVTIGNVTTPEPVFILAVNKATCAKDRPDCPARLFGDRGPGGIMGVGLGDVTSLDNPLEYLPPAHSGGFIIQGRGPGGRAFLTLGLTPANRAGFTLFPVPRTKLTLSWRDAFFAVNALPGCVTLDDTDDKPLCGRFLLDSGSSVSILTQPSNAKGAAPARIGDQLPAGKRVTVALEGMPPLSLTNTATPWGDAFRLSQGNKAHSILGAGFFTLFDVLYDIKGSAIGLRPAR